MSAQPCMHCLSGPKSVRRNCATNLPSDHYRVAMMQIWEETRSNKVIWSSHCLHRQILTPFMFRGMHEGAGGPVTTCRFLQTSGTAQATLNGLRVAVPSWRTSLSSGLWHTDQLHIISPTNYKPHPDRMCETVPSCSRAGHFEPKCKL
jgi:hypothetical protein